MSDNLYAAVKKNLERNKRHKDGICPSTARQAEQKRIEAEGIRDVQIIIQEGMTENNIAWRDTGIGRVSFISNAKIIITDGKAPVLINE